MSFAFEAPVLVDESAVFQRPVEAYRLQLTVAARAAGLPVLGAESAMFGVDRSEEAIWRVGVEVEVTCFPLGGFLRNGHARCVADARWEVADAATGVVAFTAATTAEHEREPGEPSARLGDTLLGGAAKALFLTGAFRAAVASPAPEPLFVPLRPCPASPISLPDGGAEVLAAGFTSPGGHPGLLVSPDGLGLLSTQALGRATSLHVRLPGGVELPAEVLRRDPELGLALIDLAGTGHRCRPVAAGVNPEARFALTTTAGGSLVVVAGPGADEPGALALTADASVAGAAGRPWTEVAMALGIGSGVPAAPPPDEEPPDFLAPARRGGTWSFSERRATRGLLLTTAAFAAGGLATWAGGQGDEPPVTGSPLVVVNTHLWAGALTLGAVSGVQIAQASRTP